MTEQRTRHPEHIDLGELPDEAPQHSEQGIRGVLLPVAVGTLIGVIFVALFVALFHAPAPHRLPVAVVGDTAAVEAALEAIEPGGFAVKAFDSVDGATTALADRDVYGVFVPDAGGSELILAGANGPSVTGLLTGTFTALAEQSGGSLEVRDVVPISSGDTAGLSTFYAGFGVVLAGFLFGQISYGMAPLLSVRRRLTSIGIFGLVNGIVVALIVGRVGFNALPGNFFALAGVIALLAAANAGATVAIIRLVGPAGTMISAILLLILGNATAGGTLPVPFLPVWLQWPAEVLPAGVGIRALKGAAYFNGDGLVIGPIVLALWILGAAALLVGMDYRAKRALQRTATH